MALSGPLSRRRFGQALGLAALTASPRETAAAWRATAQATPPTSELCDWTAVDLVARIRRREVSAVEVMRAHLARIDRVNPRVNAIVTLVAERALADAARADAAIARGESLGVLHGLPVAHKDLVDTAGIRTTRGSRIFADHVPTGDATIVTRMRAAGAITCGKTNTPEFGAGSQTFNEVFGPTRNPYDLTRTCGGSSGGAAVALACGMVPIADGSDAGGSLRNPAAYCNVVGFRPSPGRVPGTAGSWSPIAVLGPMARTVADAALLLSVLAGPDERSPLSLADETGRFRGSLTRDLSGLRVAWWRDLGGLPFEPEIREVVDATKKVFQDLGCRVEQDEPDFAGVGEAVPILRFAANHAAYAPRVREHPEWVKDTIQFEVREAERLTAADVGRAMARQTRMYDDARQFFTRHDVFVLPVTQVSPFPVDQPYPTRIGDTPMPTYIDWMRACWYVTFMGCPAISVPAGFTRAGLPVGLQIVGRHRDDLTVLQVAHAFEQATRHGQRRPGVLGA
jgi:amidase